MIATSQRLIWTYAEVAAFAGRKRDWAYRRAIETLGLDATNGLGPTGGTLTAAGAAAVLGVTLEEFKEAVAADPEFSEPTQEP